MKKAALVFFCTILTAAVSAAQLPHAEAKAEVLKAEEAFSQAKLHNDVAALDRLLAPEYTGINQWGAIRDKKSALDLFKDFSTTSLTPSHITIRVVNDTAILHGMMYESKAWKFLFMRTYIRRQGRWLLLSSVHTFPLTEDMKPFDPELVFQQPN
jgi:hypothetical protein